MTHVVEANSRNPDPDEPWRYVCPECGRQVHGYASMKVAERWRCQDHGTFAMEDLEDLKA